MEVTQITNDTETPIKETKAFTEQELKQEYNYHMAQKMLKQLLDNGFINESDFNKITMKNRETFSPYLSEIMPEIA